MTTTLGPKDAFHFTYTAAYDRKDEGDRHVTYYHSKIVSEARDHYEKMIPFDEATVVIDEPRTVAYSKDRFNGRIILEVTVSVFFN